MHLLNLHTSQWNGSGLGQCNAQLRATGNIAVTAILAQKLQHGEILRVVLYLIEEHQRIGAVTQSVAGYHAEGQVEILFLVEQEKTYMLQYHYQFH